MPSTAPHRSPLPQGQTPLVRMGHATLRRWSAVILGRMLTARKLWRPWESWPSFRLPSSSLFIWWQSLSILTVATIIHWNTFTVQQAEAGEVSIWWFYGSVLTRSPSNVGACAREDNQSLIQAGVRGRHLLNIMTPIPDRLETFWASGQDSKKKSAQSFSSESNFGTNTLNSKLCLITDTSHNNHL